MTSRIAGLFVAVLFVSTACAQLNEHLVQENQPAFEYCMRYVDLARGDNFESILNAFGKEDWEVVSTSVTLMQPKKNDGAGTLQAVEFLFTMKRQKRNTHKSCSAINAELKKALNTK